MVVTRADGRCHGCIPIVDAIYRSHVHVDLDQSNADDSCEITAAVFPPIVTVTVFASGLAPENTYPAFHCETAEIPS